MKKNFKKIVKFNKYYIIALIVIFILGVSTTYSYYAYNYENSVAILTFAVKTSKTIYYKDLLAF